MGKRIGRKRLYALNKAGESLTSTAGVAMDSNIGSQSRIRQGELLTTDVTIDLAAAAGAAASFATTGTGNSANKIIGVSSSSGTHGQAQLMLINGTASAADSVGILTAVEMICVEEPLGGEDNIGLWYGPAASASGEDLLGGTQLIAAAAQTIGIDGENLDVGADLDNKYLYLVSSGSTGAAYTAGKFVLRLYGYNVFDDV